MSKARPPPAAQEDDQQGDDQADDPGAAQAAPRRGRRTCRRGPRERSSMPESCPGDLRQRMGGSGPAAGGGILCGPGLRGARRGVRAPPYTRPRAAPEPDEAPLSAEPALLGAALALGARDVAGWSAAEAALARDLRPPVPPPALLGELRERIAAREDPLGEAFCRLRPPQQRRGAGATYTPAPIVASMVEWAASEGPPARVVDPGAGSGRFVVAAGRRFPGAELLAVELDPLAAAVCRGHLAAAGLGGRARVLAADYRSAELGRDGAPALYIGNPPYVRHHQIAPGWKEWLALGARAHGLEASRLAGLHVHFFLATAARARPGDRGAFITSSEWLDTNYGRLVRELLLDGLGGEAIHVLEPTAAPFEDAAVTAAITCFDGPGRRPKAVRLRRVGDVGRLGTLDGGRRRPSGCARPGAGRPSPARRAPCPRITSSSATWCRVHRGAVTGRNRPGWCARRDRPAPEVLFPSVTRAREIFEAGGALASTGHLRLVVDLPADLDAFAGAERRRIEGFLARARRDGGRPRLHRPRPPGVVVGGPARAGADPRHLHGPPAAGLHAEPRRRPPHQHRPRPLPAGRAARAGIERLWRRCAAP